MSSCVGSSSDRRSEKLRDDVAIGTITGTNDHVHTHPTVWVWGMRCTDAFWFDSIVLNMLTYVFAYIVYVYIRTCLYLKRVFCREMGTGREKKNCVAERSQIQAAEFGAIGSALTSPHLLSIDRTSTSLMWSSFLGKGKPRTFGKRTSFVYRETQQNGAGKWNEKWA